MARETASKSTTEATTHVSSRGKSMRGHCRTEHDYGQEDHRLAYAEALLFGALIERNRDRSGASGRLFGRRIESGHDLSPCFISKQFVCSLSLLPSVKPTDSAVPLESNFDN
jgi:hypothetical protein